MVLESPREMTAGSSNWRTRVCRKSLFIYFKRGTTSVDGLRVGVGGGVRLRVRKERVTRRTMIDSGPLLAAAASAQPHQTRTPPFSLNHHILFLVHSSPLAQLALYQHPDLHLQCPTTLKTTQTTKLAFRSVPGVRRPRARAMATQEDTR